MTDQVVTRELQGEVESALRVLTPEEERILRLRYGIGTSTLDRSQIGAEFGVSAARIRSIESAALQRLRRVAIETLGDMASARGPYVQPQGNHAPAPCRPDPSRWQQWSDEGRPPLPPASQVPPEPRPYDVTAWDEA